MGRIFEEIKNRPLYSISLTANLEAGGTLDNAHPGERVNTGQAAR